MKFQEIWRVITNLALLDGALDAALSVIEEQHDSCDPPRTGGCLVIADAESGKPIAMLLVGELNEKAPKYIGFAQEKAVRLAAMHKAQGHVTSRESRNTNREQYAGAILTMDGLIISFSGLQEGDDEALSQRVASTLGLTMATNERS